MHKRVLRILTFSPALCKERKKSLVCIQTCFTKLLEWLTLLSEKQNEHAYSLF